MVWKVAVASSDGKFVNQHFGWARQFLIFSLAEDGFAFLEKRITVNPCSSSEEDHDSLLQQVAEALADCQVVLVSQIGPGARRVLLAHGIQSYVVMDFIVDALERLLVSLKRSKRFV